MTLNHEFTWALDTGRVRRNNEDAVAVDPLMGVAVLADGMGGYNAGEVAAEMATSLVCADLVQWCREQAAAPGAAATTQAMQAAIDRANQAILEAATSQPAYQGMGTTLVMACLVGPQVLVGHIGDSRAYRLHQGRLQALTRDHSLLREQLDAGLITPQQAARAIHRNFVTRAVGVEPQVRLETHLHPFVDGDLLLLCSDGLTDMLDDARIETMLAAATVLDDTARALVDAANSAGGRDNISLVLIRARPQRPSSP
jgi:serine/threonine protein phosphatase PrpC